MFLQLLKKPSADPQNFANFRPVSNLRFLSKLKPKTHDATNRGDTWRRLEVACSYFVAAICRTNSNQLTFEFVQQIAATKFCCSDNDFHMSHEAICCSNLSRRRVAAICRIVCLGLNGVCPCAVEWLSYC